MNHLERYDEVGMADLDLGDMTFFILIAACAERACAGHIYRIGIFQELHQTHEVLHLPHFQGANGSVDNFWLLYMRLTLC